MTTAKTPTTGEKTFTTGTAPGAWPLLGHSVPLVRQTWDYLSSLSEYGDLVELKVGPEKVYVAANPDLLLHVLSNDKLYDKGGVVYETARSVLGNGMLSCPHADHRRQRRLLQPAFTRAQLAHYIPAVAQEVNALTESWKPGQVIDVYPTVYRLSLRILMRSLFSVDPDEATVKLISETLELIMAGVAKRMFTPERLLRLPTPGNRRYEEAVRRLHSTVDGLIDDARRNGSDKESLLSLMINSHDEEATTGLTDAEIHDQTVSLLHAGSETTAMGLTWALFRLTEHQKVQRRLQNEVDVALGGQRGVVADDIPQLSYASRVFTETLRIYPPAWAFTRTVSEPTVLAGTKLEAGTTIVCCSLTTHRAEGLFSRPDDFEPDRWLPGRPDSAPRSALTSFGLAKRRCMGDIYAWNEAAVILSTIASRWDLTTAPGSDPRLNPMSIGIYPRKLLVEVQPREARPEAAAEALAALAGTPVAAAKGAADGAAEGVCPVTGHASAGEKSSS